MHLARLLALALILASGYSTAEPFLTRDQNALLGGFALPTPLPAKLTPSGTSRIDLVTNWSSMASSGLTDSEALLVDLESRDLRLLIEHSFAEGFAVRLQIPYRRLEAGVLDGFIDGWHQALGLPEGARRFLQRDQFQIGYQRDGQTVVDLRNPVQGIGDIAIELGYQGWQSATSAASLWLTLEAPTGDDRDLLGNGAWDTGVQVAGKTTLGPRSSVYWQVGAMHLGEGRYLSRWQETWAASASGIYEYAVTPRLDLKVQADAHSAIYDSGIDFLSEAVMLTVGGGYRFASGLGLTLGVSEDVSVGFSPDVNFYIALGKPL